MADNDAGGVISYAVTGIHFGLGLFVPLVLCLAPLTFTIQEMSMRLGAVTQEGFARLARRRYGRFWGYYHISTLACENLLALIFGLGLFNAGFLASITISLSSSWSIAEVFGWSKSLKDRISDAPAFYALYSGSLALAALAILIPHVPLNLIAVLTQVIGGVLIMPLLIFLVLMTNDRGLMGPYTTKLVGRFWGWAMVAVLSGLTVATVWQTVTSVSL